MDLQIENFWEENRRFSDGDLKISRSRIADFLHKNRRFLLQVIEVYSSKTCNLSKFDAQKHVIYRNKSFLQDAIGKFLYSLGIYIDLNMSFLITGCNCIVDLHNSSKSCTFAIAIEQYCAYSSISIL